MTITLSDAAANSLLNSLKTAIDAGGAAATIKLYTGTKPAGPDTAISTQTLLGTMTCSYPCGSVASRSLTFSAVTQDSSADATGTATWARIATSAGTAVVDVDAGASGGSAFLQMNTTAIVALGPIAITSLAFTL